MGLLTRCGPCAENNPNINLIQRGSRGLAMPIKKDSVGCLRDDRRFYCQMDADLSHNPEYIPLMLHYARTYMISFWFTFSEMGEH